MSVRTSICSVLLGLASLLVIAAGEASATVTPDPAFGEDGKVVLSGFTNPFVSADYGIDGLAIKSSTSGPSFTDSAGSVGRLNWKGTETPGYGFRNGPGKSSLAVNTVDLEIDRSDRAVGLSSWNDPGGSQSYIYRLTAEGQIDRSFGRNGKVSLAFSGRSGSSISEYAALGIDAQGRYVVGGRAPFGKKFIVKRFLPTGQIDRSFADGGTWQRRLGWKGVGGTIADLETLGNQILVAGSAPDRSVVFRLDRSGRLDHSFGDNGSVFGSCGPRGCVKTTCIDSCASSAIFVQGNGTFLVAHNQISRSNRLTNVIYKFRKDGSRVRGFGQNGTLSISRRLLQRTGVSRVVEYTPLFPGESGIAVQGGGNFVLGLGVRVPGSDYRLIGFGFDWRGKPVRHGGNRGAFNLPYPDGRWDLYAAGPRRFYVTGRSGSDLDPRTDELAIYRFVVGHQGS